MGFGQSSIFVTMTGVACGIGVGLGLGVGSGIPANSASFVTRNFLSSVAWDLLAYPYIPPPIRIWAATPVPFTLYVYRDGLLKSKYTLKYKTQRLRTKNLILT